MKKYFKYLIIVLAVLIIVPQIALAAWWNPMSWGMWNRIFHFQRNQNSKVACTMEAKQCPDGSYVGRVPPKCEFKACPGDNSKKCSKDSDCPTIYCIKAPCPQNKCVEGKCKITETDATAGWKTYTNTQYGFEFKYPSNLSADVGEGNGYNVTFHSGTVYQDNLTGSFLIKLVPTADFNGFSNCNLVSLFNEKVGYNCENNCTCKNCGTPPLCSKIEKIGDNKAIRFEEIGGGFNYLLQNKNNYFKISYFGGSTLNQDNINLMLSTFKFTNSQPVVGGDKDAHGCIGSAGYTWCEVKQKCLRSWEEKCQ